MRTAIFVIISGILAGCSSGTFPVSSPYYTIPSGSRLVLNRQLTIPPNSGRVYLQYGKVVSQKEKDDYHAHCWFLSWRVTDSAQTVIPDTFIITRSIQTDHVVLRNAARKYAMLDMAFRVNDSGNSGGPMALVYSTEMQIHSDKQPDIRSFVCSHWEDPLNAKHLTIAEMQKTLGEIATIQLNNSK